MATIDFEPVSQTFEAPPSQSPPSQDLEDFQSFSRTRLPGLVENHHVSIIHGRHRKLEEDIKSSLPEIVRTTISELLKAWKESNSSCRPPHRSQPENNSSMDLLDQDSGAGEGRGTNGTIESFFKGPPSTHLQITLSTAGAIDLDSNPGQGRSDSGYESLRDYPCFCNTLFSDNSRCSD
jgi:hypothetical protein